MESHIKLLSTIGLTGVLIILLLMTAFKFKNSNIGFTCNRYILNTYLYVFLSFVIISLALTTAEHNKVHFLPSLPAFLGLFFLSLVFLIFTNMITPNTTGGIVLKHILWLGFILVLGMLFYPMYSQFTDNKIIVSAIITTLALVLLLSIVAFKKPELISLTWGPVLFTLLVTVIIFEIATMILVPRLRFNPNSYLYKGVSYFVILLFIFYILYDTKMMTIRAKKCNNNADYINESLHLFLDIFNIFVRILSLQR